MDPCTCFVVPWQRDCMIIDSVCWHRSLKFCDSCRPFRGTARTLLDRAMFVGIQGTCDASPHPLVLLIC